MALDPHWTPACSSVIVNTNYNLLPFRFKRKMTDIMSILLEVRNLSKNDYKLYLFDDGCALLDPIKNLLLCTYNYEDPVAILLCQFNSLYQFWRYEAHVSQINTQVEYNFYITHKRKFHYE